MFQLWLHLSFSGDTAARRSTDRDVRVVLGARQPGLMSYNYTVRGTTTGAGEARTSVTASLAFRGTTIDADPNTVN